ncbi:MAG: hypothetical protein ACD_73C00668G0003 [uncultured bacterium]|nr:MAG: hypothetical protein ACD_73C00668G0003 [uncultured bacterium]
MKKIKPLNRILILVVALLLIAIYFVPLWSISLQAPQYPEGLGMHLWINKLLGHSEFDLKNINLLNHYIGMAAIDEQAIPEFRFMPYVLGYMIVGALIAALWARRFLIYLGLVNLFLVGLAGFYDFWKWEYQYGHNLNPDAPISIPGMTYQPPMLGCKQLLNITSCSTPHMGAIFLGIVGLILVYILFSEKRKKTHA